MADRAAYDRLIAGNPWLLERADEAIRIARDPAEVAEIEAAMAEAHKAAGRPLSWAKTGLVYDDPYITILRDAVRFPDGAPGTFFRILTKPYRNAGAVMLPILDGEVVLVRHFRHAVRAWRLEAPRGAADGDDEAKADVARRELVEEIGASIRRVVPLGRMDVSTSYFQERMHLFLIELDAIGAPDTADGIDGVEVRSVPEVERMIRDGEITDSHFMSAFLHARLRGLL